MKPLRAIATNPLAVMRGTSNIASRLALSLSRARVALLAKRLELCLGRMADADTQGEAAGREVVERDRLARHDPRVTARQRRRVALVGAVRGRHGAHRRTTCGGDRSAARERRFGLVDSGLEAGVEGIEGCDGEHYLVADDPAAFSRKVAGLLGERRAAVRQRPVGRDDRRHARVDGFWRHPLHHAGRHRAGRRRHTLLAQPDDSFAGVNEDDLVLTLMQMHGNCPAGRNLGNNHGHGHARSA